MTHGKCSTFRYETESFAGGLFRIVPPTTTAEGLERNLGSDWRSQT